ncbi:MAG TPA: hypothetical protein VHY08_08015 [Bacillota bacterium]|nr:hypothetical protein [Bacillota bacterium]
MLRKIISLCIVLLLGLVVMSPGKAYLDSAENRQVELAVPGTFVLQDPDDDQKAEFIKFQLSINAYRERNLIVTGNLEGIRNGSWVALGTTVIPFDWSAESRRIELIFSVDQMIKYQIFGPFRVNVGLKEGQWETPPQVAGFSQKYQPGDFEKAEEIKFKNQPGEISTISQAQRAVETWAQYQGIELGVLKEVFYNYDQWQCDYQTKSGAMVRFLIEPRGLVRLFKIRR